MKKNNPADHKSNLNTSCASDLHSSILSSLCETNLNESIIKINELKLLFTETCNEQTTLILENNQLLTMLDKLKLQLQILVNNKFGATRVKQKRDDAIEESNKLKQKSEKQYKAGSIAKIKRPQEAQHEEKNRKTSQNIWREPRFDHEKHENQFAQKNSQGELFQNRIQLQQFKLAHRKIASSIISGEQIYTKQNSKFQNYGQGKNTQKMGLLTQREDGESGLRNEKSTRKSYLNSAQTSLLNSPRSTFVK